MAEMEIDSLKIEIASSSEKAEESLDKLAKSLEKLKDSLSGLSTGSNSFNSVSSSISSASTRMKVSNEIVNALMKTTDKLGDSLKKLGSGAVSGLKTLAMNISGLGNSSSSVSSLTLNLKTLFATLVGFKGITGIFNWAKESIAAGAAVTEIDHIVESVFGEDMVGYVQDWADNALESFGIASTAAKKYAGTLSAMFQASNVGMEDSNKMAMDLVELAGDLSAFYNIDTETAYNKLKSGMAGMVRPLRDLGIDLSVAALKEYALSQGIEKSYTSMTQGEKMMLRYKYLLEQTSMQSGDFGRTSLSLANSLRILKAYASEVTAQIGVGLGAALRHVIIWLNGLMKYVLKAAQAFATFMQTLFGKYKGGASGVNLDGALSDADDYAEDLADSAGSAASGLSDADDAAKQLKKDLAVLPFDELNQLAKDKETTSSTPKGTTGTSVGGIGELGDFGEGLFADAIDNVEGKLGELESFLSRWARLIKGYFNAENWSGLGKAIAWGINQGIDKLYEILDPDKAAAKINPFLDAFTKTFNSFVDAIHWDTLGADIGRGITIIVNAFNRLLDPKTGIDFENIGAKLGTLLNNTIRNVNWRGVGELISNKFMVGWRVFKGFIDEFDAEDAGLAIGEAIGGAVEKFDPVLIGHALGTAVTKMATLMKNAFGKKSTWNKLGKKIGEGINAFLEDFDGKEAAAGINAMLDALFETIGTTLKTIHTDELIKDIGDFLGNLDWGKIAVIAAGLAAITFGPALVGGLIKTIFFKTLLKNAISQALAPAITEAAATAEVKTASSGLFSGLKNALIGEGIGAGIAQGGVYAAIVAVAGKLAELQDAMKGGNGQISEVGGAFDSYINQLSEAGKITGEVKDELFLLKEQYEDGSITAEEFGTKFSKALEDSGISAETATGQIDTLASRMGNLTDNQITELESAVSGMTSTFEDHNTVLQNIGLDGEDAFKKIKAALNEADPDIIEHGNTVSQLFEETYKQTGGDAVEAISAVITKWEEMGLEPEMIKTAIDTNLGEGTYDALVTAASTSSESVVGSLDSITTATSETKNSVNDDLKSMSNEMVDLHKTSRDSAGEIGESEKKIASSMFSVASSVAMKMALATLAMVTETGLIKSSMNSTADSATENGEAIPTNMSSEIESNSYLAEDSVKNLADGMTDEFNDNFDVSGMIAEAFDNIEGICEDLYDYGEQIGEAFKDGIESVNVTAPHIEWAGTYTRVWTGANSYTDVPDYTVNWYAKGALFTKPSIVGIGEAGDEAALPLENQATMNRIARAIVDNSDGAFGLSEDQLASAVARGYVQAMMSNQGNERPMVINATLYTEDNEVLARAVQKGNQSIDFRNNATPQYS